MKDARSRVLRLDRDGEGKVTAGDITPVEGVEVLNPEHTVDRKSVV